MVLWYLHIGHRVSELISKTQMYLKKNLYDAIIIAISKGHRVSETYSKCEMIPDVIKKTSGSILYDITRRRNLRVLYFISLYLKPEEKSSGFFHLDLENLISPLDVSDQVAVDVIQIFYINSQRRGYYAQKQKED
jgi:hypothetical protein